MDTRHEALDPTWRSRLAALARAARAGVLTTSAAAAALNLPSSTRRVALHRLMRGGWLRRVRRGVYLIAPIEATPSMPITVEDPWVYAALVYAPGYIGGWTAAEHWGLTEQVFHSTFVVTCASVRRPADDVAGQRFRLARVARARAHVETIVWRGAVRVPVSDRERTVADSLRIPAWIGGGRHLVDVLTAYRGESWNVPALIARLEEVAAPAAYSRLGLIVSRLWPREHGLIAACAKRRGTGSIALDPAVHARGVLDAKWGVRVNVEVEGRGTRP